MKKVKEYVKQQWFAAYKNLSDVQLKDIYVFSFLVSDDDGDPRRPTLTIEYNTYTNLH